MDENLKIAAKEGDINMLYNLIQQNPNILECVDQVPFIETPLHTAAYHGKIPFAKEIMRLKPSFARKLNQQGFSPLHVALFNGQTKMALRFLNYESGRLVRIQGKEGKTPLHHVAEQGDLVLLTKFLSACPMSIQDVTIYGETALHSAVKNEKVEAFDILLGGLLKASYKGSLTQERVIINQKNEEGKTVLHIATTMNQAELVRLLLDCGIPINLSAKDDEGNTALDIATTPQIKGMLENAMKSHRLFTATRNLLFRNSGIDGHNHHHHSKSKLSFIKSQAIDLSRMRNEMDRDTVNLIVVVTALILTATYQAALSPPGGLWQDNSNNNNNNNINTLNTTCAVNTTIYNGTNNPSATTFIIDLKDVDNRGNSSSSSKAQRAGTLIMSSEHFHYFFACNSVTLLASSVVIFFLVPGDQLNWLLLVPLYLFSVCYMFSWKLIASTPDSFRYFFFVSFVVYSVAGFSLVQQYIHFRKVDQEPSS